ncbi:MAG: Uncharacterised protein [Flavobacteriia bacterium]|nr:MAG: Uncharacterised protein [Flavobacteriia bacterium]
MDANGTGQLGQTGDRCLHFLAGGHDQISKLIHNENDIGQIAVSFLRIQFALLEFGIVFFDVAHHGVLQKLVALIHLDAQ